MSLSKQIAKRSPAFVFIKARVTVTSARDQQTDSLTSQIPDHPARLLSPLLREYLAGLKSRLSQEIVARSL